MQRRTMGLILAVAAVFCFAPSNSASAAEIDGTWELTAGAVFDVQFDQFGPVFRVTEFQSAGDIGGIGFTSSTTVIWFDDLGQIYIGQADSSGTASMMSGIAISTASPGALQWSAVRVP